MNIRNEINAYIVQEGFTMSELVEKLAEQYGWSPSVPNLSNKLRRGSLRSKEAVELADALGYDLVWQKHTFYQEKILAPQKSQRLMLISKHHECIIPYAQGGAVSWMRNALRDFLHLISGIHGNMQKLKTQYAAQLGLKPVHVLWLYLLRQWMSRCPEHSEPGYSCIRSGGILLVHRVRGELVLSPPKTKASNRNVILPLPVLNVLKAYKETVTPKWMFPSPVNEDSPRDPATVRKRLQTVLERAGCKKIRFHDLRHTFSTAALEHGMDVKTLSTIIGHVSSSTTLNIYAHVTDEMRRTAAVKIEQGTGKVEPQTEIETAPLKPVPSTFQAHKGQRRKAGTGCVSQINEKLWEGRYSPIWPDGKKHVRNVYAHSEEECKNLLAELIAEMKAEIAIAKENLKITSKRFN